VNIFINEKTIEIVSINSLGDKGNFDCCISTQSEIISKHLKGKVLIYGATTAHVERILKLLELKKLKKLYSITLASKDPEFLKDYFKDEFKIVKAAGGLVIKENKILMIYRLGKWDLPKGKLKKGEPAEDGAVREVEEECSLKVKLESKICATWHTYDLKGKKMLKKTFWYLMQCVDDQHMRPQLEENIEEVRWMTKEEALVALDNSYKSIEKVLQDFYK
jgi:ADP-ribose pyrophosphatase YjhB (NUDIX family)